MFVEYITVAHSEINSWDSRRVLHIFDYKIEYRFKQMKAAQRMHLLPNYGIPVRNEVISEDHKFM